MSGYFDVVLGQRACREFLAEPVDDELIEQVLTAATHAPSAENRQPWVFVVLRDPERRRALGALARAAWEGGARRYAEGRLSPGLLAEVDRGARGSIAEAPVLVVVCGDHERSHPKALGASIFPAVQNLLLAANALGLGSAMTTLPVTAGAGLAELLGLPAHIEPMAVVPLGRPARTLGAPRREPMGERTFRERFGSPW